MISGRFPSTLGCPKPKFWVQENQSSGLEILPVRFWFGAQRRANVNRDCYRHKRFSEGFFYGRLIKSNSLDAAIMDISRGSLAWTARGNVSASLDPLFTEIFPALSIIISTP